MALGDDGWWYRYCVERNDLAVVHHSVLDANYVDLRRIAGPHGQPTPGRISVYNVAHRIPNDTWRLDTTSVPAGPDSVRIGYFTAQRIRNGIVGPQDPILSALPFTTDGWYTQLLFRCRNDALDSLFWEIVPDADYATTGRAVISPRADDTRPFSNHVQDNMGVWEFVGILFRAKAVAKLHEWSYETHRARAVVFAAEALLDAMNREPALVDELEPIALHLLETDVKTVDDLAKALAVLSPQASDCVLRACTSYDDFWCTKYEMSFHADVRELEVVLN